MLYLGFTLIRTRPCLPTGFQSHPAKRYQIEGSPNAPLFILSGSATWRLPVPIYTTCTYSPTHPSCLLTTANRSITQLSTASSTQSYSNTSAMANIEALYETGERHTRYARDTNLFLVELITTAKRMTTADKWQHRTEYSTETHIKDSSTRVFKEAAKLLRSDAGESIVLSRLCKLVLDRAILDRKDQASFF